MYSDCVDTYTKSKQLNGISDVGVFHGKMPYSSNPLLFSVPFLYPWKTTKSLGFSHVFRGYKKGTPSSNGLRMLLKLNYYLSWTVSRQYKNELTLVKIYWMVTIIGSKGWYFLTFSMPIPQNDQTLHKQFFGNSTEIVWVCLTILRGWGLRVKKETTRGMVQKTCSKSLKLKDKKTC